MQTWKFSAVIRVVENANATIPPSERPSGTTAMTSGNDMINIWMKVMPFW